MPIGLLRPSTIALALVAGLVVAAVSGMQGARPALALTNCSVSDSFDPEERAFLDLINAYRVQNGRAELTVSSSLNRASAWMAEDLGEENYFSHTDSLGRSFDTRLSQCDARPNYGENIAAGTNRSSAQSAFAAWRASPGHNTNMLRSSFRQIGIARYYDSSSRYGWYWVTDFSTSDDGSSAGSGATGGGSSSGSATASPTPTAQSQPAAPPPSAPVEQAAKISSPPNGSTLGYSEVFRWSAVSGAKGYRLSIGTSPGSANLLSAYVGSATAIRISGFPSSGDKVYVRLWTQLPSGWVFSDYSYRMGD